MNITLKRSVNKKTAISLMAAINKITLAENLLRKDGYWLFSVKPKKEIPTMSIWFQILFHKYIRNIS